MDESELRVFIHGATRYFQQITRVPAEIGAAYLANPRDAPAYDMTGIIGVSGARKGCVYLTAPKAMLNSVLLAMGENDLSHHMHMDLAGEIANTIAGNAREHFGTQFMISVPIVVAGTLDTVKLPEQIRSFVIPLTWHRQNAAVVVCLE